MDFPQDLGENAQNSHTLSDLRFSLLNTTETTFLSLLRSQPKGWIRRRKPSGAAVVVVRSLVRSLVREVGPSGFSFYFYHSLSIFADERGSVVKEEWRREKSFKTFSVAPFLFSVIKRKQEIIFFPTRFKKQTNWFTPEVFEV